MAFGCERQSPPILGRRRDFDTASIEHCLGDESNFGIMITELHILVISHLKFSNTAASDMH